MLTSYSLMPFMVLFMIYTEEIFISMLYVIEAYEYRRIGLFNRIPTAVTISMLFDRTPVTFAE